MLITPIAFVVLSYAAYACELIYGERFYFRYYW